MLSLGQGLPLAKGGKDAGGDQVHPKCFQATVSCHEGCKSNSNETRNALEPLAKRLWETADLRCLSDPQVPFGNCLENNRQTCRPPAAAPRSSGMLEYVGSAGLEVHPKPVKVCMLG